MVRPGYTILIEKERVLREYEHQRIQRHSFAKSLRNVKVLYVIFFDNKGPVTQIPTP